MGEGVVVGEWRWADILCRTFRLCHKQLHIGKSLREWWEIQDKQQKDVTDV